MEGIVAKYIYCIRGSRQEKEAFYKPLVTHNTHTSSLSLSLSLSLSKVPVYDRIQESIQFCFSIKFTKPLLNSPPR
ncbi:hypothetical protein L2E82_31695 [Cichorium intybus]|uniref:Uncharacterized protein n=1 Tax=Cichorium intybus TaxID=13427 RepID=A0ACB9BF49_CICIN|nr:hypothetical protein L2E82_31695 [Cichorium intybus]